MNWLSHSSVIVFAGLSVAACTRSEDEIALVRPEAYDSRVCWFDQRGDFAAFLVLARDDRMAVPYLVSAACLVTGDYSSQGEATLHVLNTIRLSDSYGSLQRAMPELDIVDNISSDLPLPSSDSKVYYMRARIVVVPNDYRTVYAPRDVFQLSQLNLPFGTFLELSTNDRESLLIRYRSSN
jgi:hypothetical protein